MNKQEQKVPGGGGGGRPVKPSYVPDTAQQTIRATRGIRGMLGGPGSSAVEKRLKALAKPSKGALLLLLLGLLSLQASGPIMHSMGTITFVPESEVLSWEVKVGMGRGESFRERHRVKYSIDFTTATMTKKGKAPLPFSREEQERMRTLFHQLLVHYTMASTEWYEKGGEKLEPDKNEVRACVSRF